MTLANYITDVGACVTAIVGFAGDILEFAVGNPVILFSILAPIVYTLIKFSIKLVRVGGGKRRR